MTIILVLGVVLIAFIIASACCPVVDKIDLELEQWEADTEKDIQEKSTEIMEILGMVNECKCGFDFTAEVPNTPPADNIDDAEEVIHAPIYFECSLSHELQDHIYKEYLEQGFDDDYAPDDFMALMISIIQWESGFNSENSNGKNHGLMSVMTLTDDTMKAWGITDLMDPFQNITAGIHCFKNAYNWAMLNADEDYYVNEYALAAYNLGRDGAEKFLRDHSIRDLDYANNIMGSFNRYIYNSIKESEETKND